MAYVKRKKVAVTTAFLIGVPDNHLDTHYSDCTELLDLLKNTREACVIRYLCKLRTALMNNFRKTDYAMLYELKNLKALEWFDANEVKSLEKWGIPVLLTNSRSQTYMAHFCKLIDTHIDACKQLYPSWLNWSYIRELFVTPKYMTDGVMLDEFAKFQENKNLYPFQMYIYWKPFKCGGMVSTDECFIDTVYFLHNDKFTDRSKLKELSIETAEDIVDFIKSSEKTVIAVDCENVDVYKVYGFLNTLDKDTVSKIEKVVLYDDVHTVETWKELSKFIKIPVEYIATDRVLHNKSVVDQKLTIGVCESHYRRNINSFILVSSDSDFMTLISSLPNAKFMLAYEKRGISRTVLNSLSDNNILGCCLDDFYSGDSSKMKEVVLLSVINSKINMGSVNLKSLVEETYKRFCQYASEKEVETFYKKCVRCIEVSVGSNGEIKMKI